MPEPTTQKGQLDSIFTALGVTDFTGAMSAVNSFKAAAGDADKWQNWQNERAALFTALGGTGDVPEHYDFAAGITALKNDHAALMNKLGATDQGGSILALDNLRTENNNLKAVQTSMFGALKATDHAGAMRAIKEIDDRIEAGVKAGVITRAASAGLTEPVKKGKEAEGAGAKTMPRAEFAKLSAKDQREFSINGGVLTEA